MCAPTSDPFSITQTDRSLLASLVSCFNLIAALNPEGPAPTTTTSYSIISLFVIYLPWILFEKIILVLVIFTIYFILCI